MLSTINYMGCNSIQKPLFRSVGLAIILFCERMHMINGIAAIAAFNLVCTGTLTSKSLQDEDAKPYSITYRIDLDAGQWCDGECRTIKAIQEVHPKQLVLIDRHSFGVLGRQWSNIRFDRETGKHTATESLGIGTEYGSISTWQGQCDRADFGGFPEFNTKF